MRLNQARVNGGSGCDCPRAAKRLAISLVTRMNGLRRKRERGRVGGIERERERGREGERERLWEKDQL